MFFTSILFLLFGCLNQALASGNLISYGNSNGYSSLIYAINQQSLRLVNFTSTFSGGLALLGNAILATCGRFHDYFRLRLFERPEVESISGAP